MVHVHHTFSLCFVLFINCTCSVCKFTTIEHHPNEKVRNTDIFCLWPIQVADKYTYHNKKFLNHNISCGVSERATMFYLNNERHFNFSFTNSFGNNGNCYRSGVTWWYSKFPIEESSRFCAIEQKSWSPLRYNLAWWGEHETSEQYCLIRLYPARNYKMNYKMLLFISQSPSRR